MITDLKNLMSNTKNNFYIFVFVLLLFSNSNYTFSQNLIAYNNYQRQFVIHDGLSKIIAEQLESRKFEVGKNLIAYIDNSQQFKIYFNNQVIKPSKLLIDYIHVSDNLCVFSGGQLLGVFENGKHQILSGRASNYQMGDSILIYKDDNTQKLYLYYNEKVEVLEDYFASESYNQMAVGDNIVAYNNFANQFKIYYHGESIVQEDFEVFSIEAARNIVSYNDANNFFKVFYKGDTYLLDRFKPKKYLVADNLVAFVGSDGQFKIFYDGKIKTIGYYMPNIWGAKDNVLWYEDVNGYFQIFHKGNTILGDIQIPTSDIMVKYNSLLYFNRFSKLIMFRDGELHEVTTMPVKSMGLGYDVMYYELGFNTVKIFSNELLN